MHLTPEVIEAFAIRVALGNNGGQWATHYTEPQKNHWRQFIRDLVNEVQGNTDCSRSTSLQQMLR